MDDLSETYSAGYWLQAFLVYFPVVMMQAYALFTKEVENGPITIISFGTSVASFCFVIIRNNDIFEEMQLYTVRVRSWITLTLFVFTDILHRTISFSFYSGKKIVIISIIYSLP
eukprot:UN07715